MHDNYTSWRKSSLSGNPQDSCVEIALGASHGYVGIRDTKDRSLQALEVTLDEWNALTAFAASGAFGLARPNDSVTTVLLPSGEVLVSDLHGPHSHLYTEAEWSAFLGGIADGQFTLAALLQPA